MTVLLVRVLGALALSVAEILAKIGRWSVNYQMEARERDLSGVRRLDHDDEWRADP